MYTEDWEDGHFQYSVSILFVFVDALYVLLFRRSMSSFSNDNVH